MYASIRRYEGIDESRMDEMIRSVKEGFIPRVSELAGFQGYYVVTPGKGVLATVSVFDSQTGADESARLAADYIKNEGLADTIPNPPQITAGEVTAHRVAAGALT